VVIAPLKELEEDLRRVETVVLELLQRRGGAVRLPAELMFKSGGKRLRPALVLLSSRILGERPDEAVKIGAAVEMVHGASLLHDDVIDGTFLRRGQPTLNALQGNKFTVLLGDFLLCESLLAVSDLNRVVLVQVVSESVALMTLGQLLELAQQGNPMVTEPEYIKIIEGKTASLMSCACKLGALLSGANADQVAALGEFGLNLGIAFQIIDDILDFWGDPKLLGKPVGSDLGEKKFTLPFLVAMQMSGDEDRGRIQSLVSNGKLQNGSVQEVVTWMDGHQARPRALDLARAYADKARHALNRVPAGPARIALEEVLEYVLERDL
jgi:octaprenyl-diphosphate synthase